MENNSKALQPGTVLHGASEYRIIRVIGSGGFGITYLASTVVRLGNIKGSMTVAIKEHFISAHCERGEDATAVVCPGTQDSRVLVANSLKDFIAEARRLAEFGVGHSNIVRVNEIFEANGTAYYVMEYLDGHSLADYIAANGPLDEEHIRAFVVPVVDAASFLHSHRLTHLDIKPGNIMLASNEDGSVRPVLIDFGLSKHYNVDGSATSTVNTMACSDGFSPAEQYSGIRTFSPTADVYALGATMYSAATGAIPTVSTEWPSGEPAATISALHLSDQLRTAMMRAMFAHKNDRYPDAGALLAALGGRSKGCTIPLPKSKRKPKNTRDTELINSGPIHQPGSRNLRKPMLYGATVLCFLIAAVIVGIVKGYNRGEKEPVPLLADTSYVAEVGISEPSAGTRVSDDSMPMEREQREHVEAGGRQTVDAVNARLQQRLNQLRTPHNLDLAVGRDGRIYYFNQSNWRGLIQSGDEKLGVVIIGDGQRFILSLKSKGEMTWNEAMERFGNVMPTIEQGNAMLLQYEAVNAAMRNYGGAQLSDDNEIWTRTEYDSSSAFVVGRNYGGISSFNTDKDNFVMVRTVLPVSEREAI